MKQFRVTTESTCDLPASYMAEHGVGCIQMNCIIDEVVYDKNRELPWKEFYRMVREEGKMPTTSQVTPTEAKEYFEEWIQEDKNILHLSFSSGLSGTCGSVQLAALQVMEEHPDCKIVVVDSLAASMGQGLFVHKLVELCEAGKSLEETADWARSHVQNMVHAFTVDDLFHLHRGGRVSKTAAVLGTLAGIKPMLHVDKEGHLAVIGKVRGRKKSLLALVDYMEEKMGRFKDENDIVFIAHGDALEDAYFVRDKVKERLGIENVLISHIGPTIGTHSGPGTMTLFFMGEER